ncbi:Pentatricopeptide repeat-containing protein, mitochondrial [Sesamum alatum]|uniref:Pentatricopeptide repeat-containing protein, mitochondrial n=1 Tax=Sesamum alatum TaxID=300844 RepID=A0AAE2C8V4_9LAMI|nr:Pentatricopeptide repeat-containing protein, mitochondrial [Sesamum alatum]
MIKRLQFGLNHFHSHVNRGVQNVAHPSSKIEQSLNVYISSLCKQKLFKDALRAFDVLEKNANCLIDPSTYALLISACSSLRSIDLKSKDLISWSSMIAGFSKLGYELEALCCFKEMLFQGTYYPNEFIFGSIFSACGCLGQPEYGRQIHGISIKYGFERNAFAGCSLTDMYAKCGFLCSAKTAFDLIENPDIASWNAVIAGFAYGGDANEAMLIFSQMRHLESVPDDITVRSLLCGFVDPFALSQGKQLHSYIIKIGLDMDIPKMACIPKGTELSQCWKSCGCRFLMLIIFHPWSRVAGEPIHWHLGDATPIPTISFWAFIQLKYEIASASVNT